MPVDLQPGQPQAADAARYSRTAMAFHWATAVLLLVATGLALFREALGPLDVWMISAHKLVGLTVLALGAARLGWRFRYRAPPLPGTVGRTEAWVARTVHRAMYLLAIVVPAAGWIFVSMAPDSRPLHFRGPDNVPRLPLPVDDGGSFLWHEVHEILGFVLIALFLVHVAGVLRHELLGSGGIASRMLPRPAWARALLLAVGLAWLVGLSLDMMGIELPGVRSAQQTPD